MPWAKVRGSRDGLGLAVATDRWLGRPDSARSKNLPHPRSLCTLRSARSADAFRSVDGVCYAPGEAERIPNGLSVPIIRVVEKDFRTGIFSNSVYTRTCGSTHTRYGEEEEGRRAGGRARPAGPGTRSRSLPSCHQEAAGGRILQPDYHQGYVHAVLQVCGD